MAEWGIGPQRHKRRDSRLFLDSLLAYTLEREHGWSLMSHPLSDNFVGRVVWRREHWSTNLLTDDAGRLVDSLIGAEPIRWGVLRVTDPQQIRFIVAGRVGVLHHPLPIWLVSSVQTVLELQHD